MCLSVIPNSFTGNNFAMEWKLIGLLHDYDSLRKPWFQQPGESHANETKQSAGRSLARLLLKDTDLAVHVEDVAGEGGKTYGSRVAQKIDQPRGRGLSHLYKKVKDQLKITGNGVKKADQLSDESANLWGQQSRTRNACSKGSSSH
ncbi:hypothetical protein V8E36_004710 [Tilletia maclaganii]